MRGHGDEDLPHEGLAVPGDVPDPRGVRGHGPPAQHPEATLLRQRRERPLAVVVVCLVQVQDPRRVMPQRRQLHVLLLPEFAAVESMRDRSEDSGSVSGVIVTGAGAAMVHALGQSLRIAHDLV